MAATAESKVYGKERKYLEEEHEVNTKLLPKLPNKITVQLICTKLPWQTFHVLSSVSCAWLGAIRSGEINDTRVRSGTAETLACLGYTFLDIDASEQNAMALYSLRDKAFYLLPTEEAPFGRIWLRLTECITMGGKVYILGETIISKVWVIDLAGQKKRQECASMLARRSNYGCAVFEGKIYVFGGYGERDKPINFSEVYDPKVDAWNKISPMKSCRMMYTGMHNVTVVRDEVWVDAEYYDPDYYGFRMIHWRPIKSSRDGIEAYNPAKDSWRTILPGDFKHVLTGDFEHVLPGDFGKHELQAVGSFSYKQEKLFTAHGRLHFLSEGKILVIDVDQKSVKGLHTCSFEVGSDDQYDLGPFWPHQVLVTNNGLLIIGNFEWSSPPLNKCRLLHSGTIELGIGKKEIPLEKVECPPLVSLVNFSFLQPIEL